MALVDTVARDGKVWEASLRPGSWAGAPVAGPRRCRGCQLGGSDPGQAWEHSQEANPKPPLTEAFHTHRAAVLNDRGSLSNDLWGLQHENDPCMTRAWVGSQVPRQHVMG